MKKALVLMLLLVTETAVASLNRVGIAPYILVAAMIAMFLLVALGKINPKYYPIYLYGLGLSAVWQTSMLGSYLVGVDIHTEMASAKYVIEHGWNIASSDGNATSLVVAVVTPFLSKWIDPVWQFKALYPAMFAAVPMILFFAYRHMIGDKKAFLAAMFIMAMPMFTMETPSMIKGLVSQTFLALVMLFMFHPFKSWVKFLGLTLSIIGVVVNHYTVAFVAASIVLGILGMKLLFSLIMRRTVGYSWKPIGIATVCVMVTLFGYYSIVSQGGMIATVKGAVTHVANVAISMVKTSDVTPTTTSVVTTTTVATKEPSTTTPQSTPDLTVDKLMQGYLERTGGDGDGLYLENQEPIVKTALGLDFASSTWLGRIFRVLQLITELAIMIGVGILVIKRKYPFEYIAGVLVCLALVLGCLFIPFLSITVSATRFYQLSLIFLAPALVLGFDFLARGRVCAEQE